MQLQIQENFMSAFLDFLHNLRSLRIVKLHADFDIRFFLGEFVQKCQRFLCRSKIAGDNYVFSH